MKGKILSLNYKESIDFLLPKHYSGRKPNIKHSYGWYIDKRLVAVCTFGKPASNSLCVGVCGKEYSQKVYELNRLCSIDELEYPLSSFVSACLRRIKNIEGWIIVSYADTAMGHNGYIYQACNFIYTGMTKKRTDKYTAGNKHSRHYEKDSKNEYRKVRSPKHRYIYFAMKKKEKIKAMSRLRYNIEEYPKGENSNYKLGEYLQPEVIKCR